MRTLQLLIAIPIPQIPQLIAERESIPRQTRLHGERRLTHIQNDLPRKPPEPAIDPQRILRHPDRHLRIVAALQFQVQ